MEVYRVQLHLGRYADTQGLCSSQSCIDLIGGRHNGATSRVKAFYLDLLVIITLLVSFEFSVGCCPGLHSFVRFSAYDSFHGFRCGVAALSFGG